MFVFKITSMANNLEELVTCDERGIVKLWNIKFATPKIIWSKPFLDEIFTCTTLTPDGVILGTLFGKIIVIQNGIEICTILAHAGSVLWSKIISNITGDYFTPICLHQKIYFFAPKFLLFLHQYLFFLFAANFEKKWCKKKQKIGVKKL